MRIPVLFAAALFAALALATTAHAAIVTETVTYEHRGVTLEGYLAYDDALPGQRPGVLIVHQWRGLGAYEQRRARMLAELGHVAFAADVYGQGVRPADNQAASAEAGKYYGDRDLFRARIAAGLRELRALDRVDTARVAAIGYCFGGTGVLELARAGADVAGVVSFHGNLDTTQPAGPGDIAASTLVCHGAEDPYVKPEAVDAFLAEMAAADADFQLIMYADAVHSFTQKSAGRDPSTGAAYQAAADRRSWAHMQLFFAEVLQ